MELRGARLHHGSEGIAMQRPEPYVTCHTIGAPLFVSLHPEIETEICEYCVAELNHYCTARYRRV